MYSAVAGAVQAFRIDQGTGALTLIGSCPTGGDVRGVSVDPSGRSLFAASLGSGVHSFPIDGLTGQITCGSGVPAGLHPGWMAVDMSGTRLYVTNTHEDDHSVSAYVIDGLTGALTPVAGSPFQAGGGTAGIAIIQPIRLPSELLSDLIADVEALVGISNGNRNSLLSKLRSAQASIERGNAAARNQLNAFINEVNALRAAGRLTSSAADALIASAQAVLLLLGN